MQHRYSLPIYIFSDGIRQQSFWSKRGFEKPYTDYHGLPELPIAGSASQTRLSDGMGAVTVNCTTRLTSGKYCVRLLGARRRPRCRLSGSSRGIHGPACRQEIHSCSGDRQIRTASDVTDLHAPSHSMTLALHISRPRVYQTFCGEGGQRLSGQPQHIAGAGCKGNECSPLALSRVQNEQAYQRPFRTCTRDGGGLLVCFHHAQNLSRRLEASLALRLHSDT